GPTLIELHICAVSPSEFSELLPECPDADLEFEIAFGVRHQNRHAPHPLALLRARRARPRRRAADERQDELAPPHSITLSTSASSCGGISRPSAFAVLRLITSSNFVGCSTGKSAGLAPFNILSTKIAAF